VKTLARRIWPTVRLVRTEVVLVRPAPTRAETSSEVNPPGGVRGRTSAAPDTAGAADVIGYRPTPEPAGVGGGPATGGGGGGGLP
jgi:hypothetical protein